MGDERRDAKKWESPELKHVGEVGEILQKGNPKLSQDNPEPGENPTKPPGH